MAARVLRVDPASPDPGTIAEAAEILVSGGLVAFPTETVYGLGADALNPAAVQRIFAVKGRPADNPLIVHVAEESAVESLVLALPAAARTLIDRCWPGPLTLVLPAAPQVPLVTRGGLATVAVRMPAHPVALALIRAAKSPVAAPSANRSGRPSPTMAEHVEADLGAAIDVILDAGPTPVGVESTVLDLTVTPPALLRSGGVPVEALRELIGEVALPGPLGDAVVARAPGTRYRHYAPHIRVVLVESPTGRLAEEIAATVRRLWDQGLRVGAMVTAETAAAVPPGAVVRVMGPRAEPAMIASRLFALLRELDEADLDAIVVEAIEERGLGRAVMDRLRRAAAGV